MRDSRSPARSAAGALPLLLIATCVRTIPACSGRFESRARRTAAPPPAAEPRAAPKPAARVKEARGDARADLARPAQTDRAARAPDEPWPFGLEPGLDADDSCARPAVRVDPPCRFDGDIAELVLVPPVAFEDEEEPLQATSIRLRLRNGGLDRVVVRLRTGIGEPRLREFGPPE